MSAVEDRRRLRRLSLAMMAVKTPIMAYTAPGRVPETRVERPDPMALVVETANALTQASLHCGLYGGMALAAYGNAREAPDAAYVCRETDLSPALTALHALYPDALPGQAATLPTGRREQSLLIPNGSGQQAQRFGTVTFVTHIDNHYMARMMHRCIDTRLLGIPMTFISPEDFLVLNVLSDSVHDIEDAISVLFTYPQTIDRALVVQELRSLVDRFPEAAILQRWGDVEARAAVKPKDITRLDLENS
ncbi:MAG TPA: hypothetical protein VKA13_01265 [Gammaproteobacteria bacterium]|nr:hypothetical protein [Gammaproteobacteria bacterium]